MNKRAFLITGASRGLGRAIALACAPYAAEMILTARTAGNLRETAAEIAEICPSCVTHCAGGNLQEAEGVAGLLREIGPERLGRVEVLVNNAGGGIPQTFSETREDDIIATHFLNLTAPALLCRAVVGPMTKRGWGRIVNISSISAKLTSEKVVAYASAKTGLDALTRCLSAEVARLGVTVNAVMPGFMLTDLGRGAVLKPMSAASGLGEAELVQRFKLAVPLRSLTEVKDVAGLVLFLAGDSAAFITGQVIGAAGGL